MLMGPTQLGESAAAGVGQGAMATGNSIAQNTIGAGNATAAADIAGGNAVASAAQSPYNMMMMQMLMGNSGGFN